MGSLMPVGSGPDKEIVTVLNNLFSGANFNTLRDHNTNKEKLFGNHRRLNRVAFRIGAYPAKDYYPDDAKRKWFYFLHHLPKATQDAIKRILSDALANNKIDGVRFSVEENAVVAAPHLYPSNAEPLPNYLNPAKDTYLVHLVVKAPMPDTGEDPPGDNDPDQNPPEVPIVWPKLRLHRPKFVRPKKPKK
jgi:hypothetical protein